MDLFIIDSCIADCIGYLSCLNSFNAFIHSIDIRINISFRHIIDDGSNSLWYCLGWNYDNILIFCQGLSLICSKDDIFIVRQNKDIICIHMVNRCQHIFGTRIHCLTTFNNIVNSKLFENIVHTVTDGYGDKSNRFTWLFLFIFSLLCCNFFSVLDQLFLMLFPHIVDLHTGKLSKCKCFLDGKSRIVRMNMDLNDIVICHAYDRIADRLKICLEFSLIF